jgi:Rrf2 family protein
MSISSRTAVAVHALTLLTQRGQDQLLTSAEIADSLNCNAAGVRRLLSQLRNAGLVEATEGSGGGWRLTRPARKITLYDAYAAVEDGPLIAGHTRVPSEACVVGRNIITVLNTEFTEAERSLQRRLQGTSIATIHDRIIQAERESAAAQH